MVCIQGKQRFIGEAAVSVARMHFRNTATDIKRLIGRKFKHPEVQKEIAQLAYKCVELPNGDVGIVLNYNDEQVTFTCEQIVAMIFNKMMAIAAAANEGVRPAYAVLSCPGFYTDVQRRALLNASKIAGLNCLRLLNEHTAIALAYGIYKSARSLFHESEPQHVMFIDMGHASYTVSVVAFVQGKLQVKSATFDRFLGGRDFDFALAQEVAQEFQGKHKINPLAEPKSRIKLLSACEKAKKNLSPHGVTATYVNIECLADEKDYSGQITLERFEELVAPLLDRLEDPIQRALKDAGIDKSQLASVEIVGGATRRVEREAPSGRHPRPGQGRAELRPEHDAERGRVGGARLRAAVRDPVAGVQGEGVPHRGQGAPAGARVVGGRRGDADGHDGGQRRGREHGGVGRRREHARDL
ncbi:hypothetical protein PINS_up020212 [Pythium insidiosum]|nr:hypothetical protein PINS_up020212 [Pythium insidiosum]